MKFKTAAKFNPKGDQNKAINKISNAITKKKAKFVTLLGVTGSGKTYTMAKVIEKLGMPTLVISPNKVLAAQLYEEFKSFFSHNNVCYFVSYYDYYQPESYIIQTDTYIEKDAKINEEIDFLRHKAVHSLLTKKDVLIVASISCIYNLGSPNVYKKLSLLLKKNQEITYKKLLLRLLDLQYERNDYQLWRGNFRIRLDFIDVWIPGNDNIVRIKLKNGKIRNIFALEFLSGRFKEVPEVKIWPAKFWIGEKEKLNIAISNIELELQEQVKKLKKEGKIIEAERLKRRTEYDIAMLKETGWCHGIENYSRHLEFKKKGETPYTLLDYFTKNFLTIIDESHITIPQIKSMEKGDRARKQSLVDYGFRLPSAFDNRPLKFKEFFQKIDKVVFTSATPGNFERKISDIIVQQIIRPTYLLDPTIQVKPTKNQIKDAISQIKQRKKKRQRVLVLALTKKLAETLSDYLRKEKIKAAYLHSEIKTLARPKILADLRKGKEDVLVGINLLREGLDLPEVSLIIILDADKEGFLRDETSLIQIIGRASRHPEGHIIMYADKITSSMKKAINETKRRRKIQAEYNKKHNLKPKAIVKEIKGTLPSDKKEEKLPKEEFLKEYLRQLKYQLNLAKRNLQFEKISQIKEKIEEIKKKLS